MGTGQSKEEALYQAVQNSNHQAVKTLRREGASLETADKEGRTPLILACTRGDLYDMVITLLNEGASLNAYRAGPHGGYPLHHAAKRGLDKTVLLLLSRGAKSLQFNDEGLTPLDMARNKSYASTVRIIEDRICLFSGMMRELSGPGFLEVIVPQFVTKKIWVVVLPAEKPERNELVIYQNSKVAIPRTVISLRKAEVEGPKFQQHDPALIITATDKTGKVRFKFLSENEGDKAQLERLWKACVLGIRQVESGPPVSTVPAPAQSLSQGLQALVRTPGPQLSGPTTPPNPPKLTGQPNPTTPISPVPAPSLVKAKPSNSASPSEGPISEEDAVAMAIKASIISASAEGIQVSPSARQASSWDGNSNKWGPSDAKKGDKSEYAGWAEGQQNSYGGWGPGTSAGAGPSRLGPSVAGSPSTSESKPGTTKPASSPTSGLNSSSAQTVTLISSSSTPAPSAPPFPVDGPIHYPSVDTSPVQLDYAPVGDAPVAGAPAPKADEKSGGQCVVCWDAPAEAICIPCGHLAGCMDCLTEIKSKEWGCPVCRAPIDQVLKVYAV